MISLLLRRLAATVVVLVIASGIAFFLMRVIPGDPARLMLGPLASAEAVDHLRRQMGLDGPLYAQYAQYVADLLHGDWGVAWHVQQPVVDVFLNRWPATAELALFAALIGVGVAISVGAFAGSRPGGPIDRFSSAAAAAAVGTPSFWLGIVLILIFYLQLRWVAAPFGRLSADVLPPARVTGFMTVDSLLAGNFTAAYDAVRHLALPAVTLGLPFAGYIFRIMRRTIVDVYDMEFIRTARAKGASERRVLWSHAVPNALLPVITVSALALGDLLAGSILVETVFNWPGIGGFVSESILSQDFAPVQGAIIIGALTYSLLNLATDILYGVIDPRVRAPST
jgi:peptide/nickel transport system permease protein